MGFGPTLEKQANTFSSGTDQITGSCCGCILPEEFCCGLSCESPDGADATAHFGQEVWTYWPTDGNFLL